MLRKTPFLSIALPLLKAGQTDFCRVGLCYRETKANLERNKTTRGGGDFGAVSKGSHAFSVWRVEGGVGSSPCSPSLHVPSTCLLPPDFSGPRATVCVLARRADLMVHTNKMLQWILGKGQRWEAWKVIASPEVLRHICRVLVISPQSAGGGAGEGRAPCPMWEEFGLGAGRGFAQDSWLRGSGQGGLFFAAVRAGPLSRLQRAPRAWRGAQALGTSLRPLPWLQFPTMSAFLLHVCISISPRCLSGLAFQLASPWDTDSLIILSSSSTTGCPRLHGGNK